MAEQVKQISRFSNDAITMALNVLTDDEWKSMKICLDKVAANLPEKERTTPQPNKKLSDDSIFKSSIIPLIQRRVVEIGNEEAVRMLDITIDFNIHTNFSVFTFEELYLKHTQLVTTEEQMKCVSGLVQFSRGLLYLEVKGRLEANGESVKEFVQSGKLNVCYMTFLRYSAFSSLLLTYPRLLLCSLSMAQILKHKKRLYEYLESDEGNDLKARLSQSFEIKVMGQRMVITQRDVTTPQFKFSTDPDWQFVDEKSPAQVPDSALKKWKVHDVVEDEELDLMEIV